jgi:hypothetical protein
VQTLRKLEQRILGWVKDVPHLPTEVQAWLGRNIWIIVMVGSIIIAVATFFDLINWLTLVNLLNDPASRYYVYGGVAGWSMTTSILSYVFTALLLVLLFTAVKPLKSQSKKGWVILFFAWLFFIASTALKAVLTLNAFDFILTLLLGVTAALITGYILFEVHAYFTHKKPAVAKVETAKKP